MVPVTPLDPLDGEVAKHPVSENLTEIGRSSPARRPTPPNANNFEPEPTQKESHPAKSVSMEQADKEHLPESGETVSSRLAEQGSDSDRPRKTEAPTVDNNITAVDQEELSDSFESEQTKEELEEVPHQREREKKIARPRQYRPPAKKPPVGKRPSQKKGSATASEGTAKSSGRDRALNIGLRVFIHQEFIMLSILPKRKPEFREQLTVTGTLGEIELTTMQGEWYQDIVLEDTGRALREGLELLSDDGTRWVLSARELFVLGEQPGVRGYVTLPRLLLDRNQLVLCTAEMEASVKRALEDAGCSEFERLGEPEGVPDGWVMFREVCPRRAVPMSEGEDILNILRPQAEIDILLEGGVRLAYNSWLNGCPPAIRVYGDPTHIEAVLIDGQEAGLLDNGTYEVPGCVDPGEHSIWCANVSKTYTISGGQTEWPVWAAYKFERGPRRKEEGQGLGICGPLVLAARSDTGQWEEPVAVPSTNPVLIGPVPGQVFVASHRPDLVSAPCMTRPPFEPVWALPSQPLHCDKKHRRILFVGEAISPDYQRDGIGNDMQSVEKWRRMILDAGRKGLAVRPETAEVKQLWVAYKRIARNLRRQLR